ncbi:MAG TPA: hypothetical protein VFM34_08785 [Moraxellaceae bacterium]|nr:hypothetical protein [Moraxellaceae bacterium]
MSKNSHITTLIKLFCLVSSAAMTASCITQQQSAGNWLMPSALPEGTCPDLAGRYMNVGQSPDARRHSYLSCELFSPKSGTCAAKEGKRVSHVSIEKTGATWQIAGTGSETPAVSGSLTLKEGDYECKDGWLTVKSSGTKGHSSSGLEFSTTSRSFTVSKGYLLERRHTEGLLMILVVPVKGSSTHWYRYPPVDSAPGQSSTPDLPAGSGNTAQ